ncbi:MAG: SpoIIE family protein phosphatase [Planctomycetaceae bacterium]|nr:SpoIIE family protein phosphatase [Planctomycetales bacterium]MCB9921478.1 SpoIIE family protein phosphatase [Planctomycetaceae bacterium]
MSKKLRVLLIEDNLNDVDLVRQTLRDGAPNDFDVISVPRLEEGLQLLREQHFDIALLDLTLPDSFGLETYHRLRTVADVPVVVLSGNTNDEVALEALELGAQDYLVKGTVSGDLLVRMLRYSITRHRLMSELQESEQRFRVLSEQLPALLWTTDCQMRFTSSRGRGLPSRPLAPDQIVGQSVKDFFATKGPKAPLIALHEKALAGESQSAPFDSEGHWYHAHVEPLKNAVGGIIGTIGVAVDITSEHKLRRDVEAAHRIQQHLLPSGEPLIRGFEVAGRCYPAEHCSGDFFDYIPMSRGRFAVVLADVSGHGFGPSILAATIRSYLRTAAVLGNQVHEMLALGNRLLVNDGDANPFASVFTVSLDSTSRSIQFSSAGHPAYLVRKNGDVEKLETPCVPIGVREDEVFPLSRPIGLERGDILLIASDGVFETRRADKEFFGLDRAVAVINKYRSHSPAEVVERIYQAACEFAGTTQLDDDLTVVIVKGVTRRRPLLSDSDGTSS